MIDRLRRGKEIVVHGDGTSLWTLTHSEDFAKGLIGLIGHPQAIGDSFHITSDETLTWNQIHEILAEAAGAEPRIVHVPSDAILAADQTWGRSLLGDKAHSVIFDNAKVRRLVPDYLVIGGERVNELAPRDRDIAMVFQNYALYPHMTVRENMGFALKLAKVSKSDIDKKVDEAAESGRKQSSLLPLHGCRSGAGPDRAPADTRFSVRRGRLLSAGGDARISR
jgi:hypothetical protein